MKTILKWSGAASRSVSRQFPWGRHSMATWTSQQPQVKLLSSLKHYADPNDSKSCIRMIQDAEKINAFLAGANTKCRNGYLSKQFAFWLNAYAVEAPNALGNFLSGNVTLNQLCQNFIQFCFARNIHLDAQQTLEGFAEHNRLLDDTVKKTLNRMPRKKHIRMMGYGLDDGAYETEIADHLLKQQLAEEVTLYGFDPYANRSDNVLYLSPEQLREDTLPKFDLVIARWVLHHVALHQRWADLMRCLEWRSPDSTVILIEHGALTLPVTHHEKRLYHLFNATFDVIANIGLRPKFFTCTEPHGHQFFIDYLESSDFEVMRDHLAPQSSHLYEIGPEFPNQTFFYAQASSKDAEASVNQRP